MKYRSRISVFLSLFIVGIYAIPLFTTPDARVAIAIVSLSLLFVVYVFITTRYAIVEKQLVVKTFGMQFAPIDIEQIVSVKRSYNPLSSPAASLKRLEVKYYKKAKLTTILISPVREQEFIEKLQAINPHIAIEVTNKQGVLRFWDWDM